MEEQRPSILAPRDEYRKVRVPSQIPLLLRRPSRYPVMSTSALRHSDQQPSGRRQPKPCCSPCRRCQKPFLPAQQPRPDACTSERRKTPPQTPKPDLKD